MQVPRSKDNAGYGVLHVFVTSSVPKRLCAFSISISVPWYSHLGVFASFDEHVVDLLGFSRLAFWGCLTHDVIHLGQDGKPSV